MDERIKNIKIAVHNGDENERVQKKLFELGASWFTINNKEPFMLDNRYLFVDDIGMLSWMSDDKKYFDEHQNKEIYVRDLLQFEPKVEDNWNIIEDGLKDSWNPNEELCSEYELRILKDKILEDVWKQQAVQVVRFDEKGKYDTYPTLIERETVEEILNKRFGME